MAYERRGFAGAAIETTLASGIDNLVVSFTLTDATGWDDIPAGRDFFVAIDPGDNTALSSKEEKIRCSGITGVTVTVATGGRGQDDTQAKSHVAGATVIFCGTATDFNEANYWVAELAGAIGAAGDLPVGDGDNSLTGIAKGANSTFFGVTAGGVQSYRKVAAADVDADIATQAELDAHLNDTTDAHDASAVSFAPTGTIAGTDAQTAIAEVATDAASALTTHEADTTNVHGIADTSVLVEDASLATTLAARQSLRADELLHVRDEKAAGTAGGGFSSGGWRTRVLNTVRTNTITGASLASNQFTLPAGTYWIEANAPAYQVERHQTKLHNVTDAADVLIGSSQFENDATTVGRSFLRGQFTIAATKAFELQHQCVVTKASNGFGVEANFAEDEIYSEVVVWKVA